LQIVGALHHGKTTLMDMLVEQTHDMDALGITPKGNKPIRFTDTRIDEQVGRHGGGARELTIGID
jgi:U5 small nuclear ribonucleoprotein component